MSKILIIEDDETTRETLFELLSFSGYDVEMASDGVEGISTAKRFLPDLIICDIMMPGKDGFDVLGELRSDPETFIIPFLFLTAKSKKAEIRLGMSLGADDYITKPFQPEDILKSVSTRLDKFSRIRKYHDEKVEELKSKIANSIPHELRTPLTVILGFAQIMHKNTDNLKAEDIKSMTEGIFEAGNRLLKLIADYSNYTDLLSIDAESHFDINYSTRFPEDIIKSISEKISTHYKRKKDLKLGLYGRPIQILEKHFIMAAEALIDNAFKFSSPGTVVVISSSTDNKDFTFTISNQCEDEIIISLDKISAFTQFGRESKEQQGTGMGLAIVKKITEIYKGSISIEQEIENEITFNISFPLSKKN